MYKCKLANDRNDPLNICSLSNQRNCVCSSGVDGALEWFGVSRRKQSLSDLSPGGTIHQKKKTSPDAVFVVFDYDRNLVPLHVTSRSDAKSIEYVRDGCPEGVLGNVFPRTGAVSCGQKFELDE